MARSFVPAQAPFCSFFFKKKRGFLGQSLSFVSYRTRLEFQVPSELERNRLCTLHVCIFLCFILRYNQTFVNSCLPNALANGIFSFCKFIAETENGVRTKFEISLPLITIVLLSRCPLAPPQCWTNQMLVTKANTVASLPQLGGDSISRGWCDTSDLGPWVHGGNLC